MSKEVHHFEELGGLNKKAYQADFLNSNGEAVDQFLVSGYAIRQRFATGSSGHNIVDEGKRENNFFSLTLRD